MPSYRLRAYLSLITVIAIWGIASPVIKFTLQGIDPLPFLAYRFLISGIIAAIYLGVKRPRIHNASKTLPLIILYGVLAFTIGLGALFVGLDNSTVLDLTLIGAISPLIITIGGAFFFHDHITKREKIGITIALCGVIIDSLLPLFIGGNIALSGNLFLFVYLLFDAGAVLLSKKILKLKVEPIATAMIGFLVAAFTLIPLAILQYGYSEIVTAIVTLPFKYHLGVWYMAIISGLIAYFFAIRGTKSIEVSEASLFYYLMPLFNVPLAVFWLGESITPTFVIGALLIGTGVFIAEKKTRHKQQVEH